MSTDPLDDSLDQTSDRSELMPSDFLLPDPQQPKSRHPSDREVGAQPGNFNALKHGIYSKQLRVMQTNDIEALTARDLDSEIAMLRTLMARTLELSKDIEDVHEAMLLLSAMSVAGGRLSSMLKTQKLLSASDDDEVTQAIDWALTEVIKEFGIS